VVSAVNGKTLYASCSGCHGAAASGNMNVLAGANSPSTIQSAISSNMGGMGSLLSLTSQNLADIAAYLATPTI
jgi:mono/diheme cytochrome c family protein